MEYLFRKINDDEFESAYKIHCDLVKNMLERGIKQWLRPIDKSKLLVRQEKNENFGLFNQKNEIKVFLSLIERMDYHEWQDWFTDVPTIWLNTVSVNINNSEKGLGKLAIEKALYYMQQNGITELYLDCVFGNGFLVKYYQSLGFSIIGETRAQYRSGTFDLVLMKKDI
jgi:N-acetylglutamate synthase-like GNAT family acetyltransferase